ncbi:MAG: L,D-transpeptidase [Sporomusaceae bacterium]|nr:L,D-transpeptidase [Sporomusaceae bacterium]
MRLVLCLSLLLTSFCGSSHASPEIYINIPEYKLTVIDKGQAVRSYDIAVGTPYEQTPAGSFAVFVKQEYPVWYPGAKFADRTPVPPGPDNPLGSRWMEFAPSYGIHGTNVDWSISYPVSGGCIRMHDADARELYERVDIGTPVTVVYETLVLVEKRDGLYLKVLPDIYGRQTSSRERFLKLFSPLATHWRTVREPVFPLKEAEDAYEVKFAVRKILPAGWPVAELAAQPAQPSAAPPLPK